MSIEAMKQAVEAFEAIKKYVTDDGAMPENWDAYHEEEYYALEALRQAIEQAEKQEPVAWIQEDRIVPEIGYDCTMTREHPKELGYKPLYTAPQKYCPSENNAAYEKGFVEGMAKQMHSSVDRAVNAMAKPWVGLTDEEIDYLEDAIDPAMYRVFARRIEAKLKEKNHD